MANERDVQLLLEGVDAWNAQSDNRDSVPDLSGLDFFNLFESAGKLVNRVEIPLAGYDFQYSNLVGARLLRANLYRANLCSADLTGANLTGANLTRADLIYANLTRSEFTRANLTYADLTSADLTGADLTGAKLWKAFIFDNSAESPVQQQRHIGVKSIKSMENMLAGVKKIKSCYERPEEAFRFYFRGEAQTGYKLQPSRNAGKSFH